MGPCAIPLGEIEVWCRLNEVEGEEREDFVFFALQLDLVWLNWANKKLKEKPKDK